MRSEAQQRQLKAAQEASHNSERTRRANSATMKRLWSNAEFVGKIRRASQTPEARAKRAQSLRRPLPDRFFSKVSPEPNSGCWLWLGSAHRLGYGQLRVEGRAVLATHVSLELARRPRPFPEACARHKCDNPNCVNPDHLEWGTLKDNSHDAAVRGRANLSGLEVGRERMRAIYEQRPVKSCEQCGSEFRPRHSQAARNKHFFCSAPCSIAWQKANYSGRPISSWSGK